MSDKPADRRGQIAWGMFDWANSPYTTLITTFVFSAYFAKAVVGNEVEGQSLWGYTSAVAMAIVALSSPIFGAVADAGGPRKPFLAFFTFLCIVGSSMLWFAKPDPTSIPLAVTFVVIGTVGFELGTVFYNAMLGDIASRERIGRLSGWAWGLGYVGGLVALVIALFGFVQTDKPLFGLDKSSLEHVRVVGPLCAVWFAIFCLPLFLWTPDRPTRRLALGEAAKRGLASLVGTVRNLRQHANTFRFMIAAMLYLDGLVTVFALGGIYAAGVHKMGFQDIIVFGIALQLSAGIGAFAFGWIDDRIGSRQAAAIAVAGLFVSALGAVLADDKAWFWFWGQCFGIFGGPAQAASRALLSRLAPGELRTEFFGLYALTGKATAFTGPFLVATITAASGSQRIGLAGVLLFFAAGLAILMTVKEPPREPKS